MLKKSSKFKQFNPRTLPGRVESTSFFNFVHRPGEGRIYLTRIKPPKTLEWLVIEKSDKNKSCWKLNFIVF